MSDIVERLRSCADDPMWAHHAEIPRKWCDEAADEIERLRAQVAASAPAPAPAEAVAWLQSYTDQGHTYKRLFLVSEFPDMGGRQLAPGVTVVPLYAAPAAPAGLREAMAAERQRIAAMLTGIDKTETESDDGWWETSTGAAFGAGILAKVLAGTAAPAGWQISTLAADLLHLLQFATISTPTEGDAAQAQKVMRQLRAALAAAPGAQGDAS